MTLTGLEEMRFGLRIKLPVTTMSVPTGSLASSAVVLMTVEVVAGAVVCGGSLCANAGALISAEPNSRVVPSKRERVIVFMETPLFGIDSQYCDAARLGRQALWGGLAVRSLLLQCVTVP